MNQNNTLIVTFRGTFLPGFASKIMRGFSEGKEFAPRGQVCVCVGGGEQILSFMSSPYLGIGKVFPLRAIHIVTWRTILCKMMSLYWK